jgi:TonB family protein
VAPDATVEVVERALNVVFFDKQTKLIEIVPDYWKCYLRNPTLKPSEMKCNSPTDRSPRIFKVGKSVSAPKAIVDRDPDYTNVARNAHYQGTVLLAVEINETGQIENVNITRPLGLGLDDASVDAVRKWSFEPARQDNDPVRVQVTIEVNFHLGS